MALGTTGTYLMLMTGVLVAIVITIGLVIGLVAVPNAGVDFRSQGAVGGVNTIDRLKDTAIDTGVRQMQPVNDAIGSVAETVGQEVNAVVDTVAGGTDVVSDAIGETIVDATGTNVSASLGISEVVSSAAGSISNTLNDTASIVASETVGIVDVSDSANTLANATDNAGTAISNATDLNWSSVRRRSADDKSFPARIRDILFGEKPFED